MARQRGPRTSKDTFRPNEGRDGPWNAPKARGVFRPLIVVGSAADLTTLEAVQLFNSVKPRPTAIVVPGGVGQLEQLAADWAESERLPVLVSVPAPSDDAASLEASFRVWSQHWLPKGTKGSVIMSPTGAGPEGVPLDWRRKWHQLGYVVEKRAGQVGAKVRRAGER